MREIEHMLPRQSFVGDLGVPYEGLAVVEVNGKQFHILPSGEPAYSERYKCAEYFQNGSAWVKEESGRWKKINKQGKEIQMSNTSSPK